VRAETFSTQISLHLPGFSLETLYNTPHFCYPTAAL
jgi:hypothetical protein